MIAFRTFAPRLYATAIAASLAALLAGCAAPLGQACTAIGWINTVDITVVGSAAALERVAWVEFCDAAGVCSRSAQQLLTPSAPPAEWQPVYSVSPSGPGRWSVDVGMSSPGNVTITAYTADSAVLASAPSVLVWNRVGGSEQCGGPSRADDISLQLNS